MITCIHMTLMISYRVLSTYKNGRTSLICILISSYDKDIFELYTVEVHS
jgi:hypothetical protein